MEELFGLSMDLLMVILLVIFVVIMLVVVSMAGRNRVMLKLGLRNIPRRRAQTILIVIGSMLSAVIVAAAFGTGDTISFSIRNDAIESLGTIDEFMVSTGDSGQFGGGSPAYFSRDRFDELEQQLAGFDAIDGMVPYVGETVPAVNLRTSLTEGSMRLVAPDPALMKGFGEFIPAVGGSSSLEVLSDNGVLINDDAAIELDAQVGDQVRLFIQERKADFVVEGIVNKGGLAGRDPTVLMPLARAQDLLNRPSQINYIAVSNQGGVRDGAELSQKVTKRLRSLFVDRQVAEELRMLLGREEVLALLEKREKSLTGELQSDVRLLRQELRRQEVTEDLIRVLADADVASEVMDTLKKAGLPELEAKADPLFQDLSEIRVADIKRRLLDLADQAASAVTTFFIIIGLFSIMVGILLIFLIFVMLAAARRIEMGMARAVGAKRNHLVQMFVFEGTAYDLAAAAIGTTTGILLSLGLVVILNRLISKVEVDFQFTHHLELRSVVVAFCLGMIIVFATAAMSAYRVSRMNIAEAVRGLPEALVVGGESSFSQRVLLLPKAAAQPLIFLWRAVRSLLGRRFSSFWLFVGTTTLWLPVLPLWYAGLAVAFLRFAWPYFRRGWLTFLLGVHLVLLGAGPANLEAPFAIGMSLMILGVGLMLRVLVLRMPALLGVFGLLTTAGGVSLIPHGVVKGDVVPILIGAVVAGIGVSMVAPLVLKPVSGRPELINRMAFTFIGVNMLVFWVLPFDTAEPITGALEADAEMFFVSGISTVAAAVWTVMYNADLLLKGITSLTSRIGRLRPVLVTAVAYPMSAKFRTGLTLAMFALVIFTLIVISLVNEAFKNTFSDPERVNGQWDIQATVSYANPIRNIETAIEKSGNLSLADFEAIGGYVKAPVDVRRVGAENQKWESYALQAVDDHYLGATGYDFKILARGYGTREEVWQALREDPSLAVINEGAISGEEGFGDPAGSFRLEGVELDQETMDPIQIQVLEPVTDKELTFTIVGVLDSAADVSGIVASKVSVDRAFPFQIPLTTYRFRVAEGVDTRVVSQKLEATFVENGMETEDLGKNLADTVSFFSSFYDLLTGYMGLGIVVGIAALGVVSMRAVVERRQQIGVLRAIGYRQGMIQLSFLLESSFIALLGVALGVALGTIVSFNIVRDIQTELEGLKFSVPWAKITLIIALAYFFSLLTTLLPARQAARTTPAEALRYE